MAAGGKKKASRKKAGGAARPKGAKPAKAATRRPALGNDPFTRGAAPREIPSPRAGATGTRTPTPPPLPTATPLPPPTATATRTARASLTDAAASATARLADVERRAESTLEGLEQRLQDLASRAGLGGARSELREVLARLLPAVLSRLSGAMELVRMLEPPERLDRFGMDPRLAERAQPLLELLYASWWRVEPRFIERVPAAGPAIVVANHGGAVPWDALVLRHALRRDHPARRDLRPLLDDHECDLPLFGGFAVRAGAVRASPENAQAILRDGGLVGVFPEGSAAASKPWRERYRILRFGRGGFAKLALRAGVPVVPCAIVGSEEAAPAIARVGWLAERLGLPVWSGSALLRLGPAALVPLPSRWTLRFGDPIPPPGDAALADDPAAVIAFTERVRSAIQSMVDEDLAGRRGVFL